LALVIECCRVAFKRGEAPAPAPRGELDWRLFLRLARFHRVQGLVWIAFGPNPGDMPPEVSEALAADAARIAADNLRAAVDCRNLLEDFGQARLPILFVKGLTLGALAYGNPSIKAAVDIDLLVAGDRLVESARIVERHGYRLQVPRGLRRLRNWHRSRKESVWERPSPRSQIDLHTRLSDNRALIPTLDVHSPRQEVEVAKGIRLPTLQTDELVAYLCVHGASSAWFRLKWIADFAALLPASTDELDRLYQRSQELGAGRAAAQAFLLADEVFQSLEPSPALRERLKQDAANRWLCGAALRQLAGSSEPLEPTSHPLGTAMIHLTQFRLLPGARFKLSELARQLRSAL
jgi:hypothetical protein